MIVDNGHELRLNVLVLSFARDNYFLPSGIKYKGMAGVLDLGFDDASSVASTVDSHFKENT